MVSWVRMGILASDRWCTDHSLKNIQNIHVPSQRNVSRRKCMMATNLRAASKKKKLLCLELSCWSKRVSCIWKSCVSLMVVTIKVIFGIYLVLWKRGKTILGDRTVVPKRQRRRSAYTETDSFILDDGHVAFSSLIFSPWLLDKTTVTFYILHMHMIAPSAANMLWREHRGNSATGKAQSAVAEATAWRDLDSTTCKRVKLEGEEICPARWNVHMEVSSC